jgi:hypothetical protein
MTTPYTVHDHKHIIFTDGRDVIHQISNEFGQQTDSGQPFMVSSDDLATLIGLFYETTTVDDEGNIAGLIPYPIKWNARFDDESRAQLACALLNTASGGAVQMRYIKHPARNEWATPLQLVILNALPESEVKTQMLQWVYASQQAGYVLVRAQMEAEGWF